MNNTPESWPEDWPMSAVNEVNKLEDKIDTLKRDLAEARRVLTEIANEDYRGNRSSASVKAYHYLQHIRQEAGEGER